MSLREMMPLARMLEVVQAEALERGQPERVAGFAAPAMAGAAAMGVEAVVASTGSAAAGGAAAAVVAR